MVLFTQSMKLIVDKQGEIGPIRFKPGLVDPTIFARAKPNGVNKDQSE